MKPKYNAKLLKLQYDLGITLVDDIRVEITTTCLTPGTQRGDSRRLDNGRLGGRKYDDSCTRVTNEVAGITELILHIG